MMDIVDRLRDPKFDCALEAADEIERLRCVGGAYETMAAILHGQVERLRAALWVISEESPSAAIGRIARAALERDE